MWFTFLGLRVSGAEIAGFKTAGWRREACGWDGADRQGRPDEEEGIISKTHT